MTDSKSYVTKKNSREGLLMENEKVKYLIDMINDINIKDKIRLAICISNSSCTNLKYDKTEMYTISANIH